MNGHALGSKLCYDDVHGWFELTYASYLVLPRSLMQAMPDEWQHRMVDLLNEMRMTFIQDNDHYAVQLRDDKGRFVKDPFVNYRYPDQHAIEQASVRAKEYYDD